MLLRWLWDDFMFFFPFQRYQRRESQDCCDARHLVDGVSEISVFLGSGIWKVSKIDPRRMEVHLRVSALFHKVILLEIDPVLQHFGKHWSARIDLIGCESHQ